MVHVSRLAEEIVLWSSAEFGFIRLPDAFATGSSIMPQKKNPDVAELARGRTGARDRRALSRADDAEGPAARLQPRPAGGQASRCSTRRTRCCRTLDVLAAMLPRIEVDAKRARKAAVANYSLATDLADYLARKGLPFREAHDAVGKLVRYAEGKGVELHELSLEELRRFSPLFDEDASRIDVDGVAALARRARRHGAARRCAAALRRARKRVDAHAREPRPPNEAKRSD